MGGPELDAFRGTASELAGLGLTAASSRPSTVRTGGDYFISIYFLVSFFSFVLTCSLLPRRDYLKGDEA